MPRILVADSLSPRAAEVLSNAPGFQVDTKTGMKPEELIELVGAYEGLLVRSATKVTAAVLERARNLKIVGRAGIGVDNVDVPAATAKGVVVMNTPLGNATTTAEHAVAMMMALTRNIPQATASMRGGKWEKSKFEGRELTGKTLGVVGLGNIGGIVAERGRGLKMDVIAYDPIIGADAARKRGAEKVTLDELLARADYITIHTPLMPETRHLIGADAFGKMKKGVFLVHCARGGIVDEQALLGALESGKVAGAALDVFEKEPPPPDHPLLQHPRVVLTPHLGASTVEAQEACAVQVAEQVVAFFRDGTIANAVNTPSVSGDALKALEPFLFLGGRLGALAGQVHSGEVERIQVRYYGTLAESGTAPVTARLLAELLNRKVYPPVNAVSAAASAKERGIAVEATAAGDHADYHNLVEVRVTGGGATTSALGAVFGKRDARVVAVNGYRLEMDPRGHTLLVTNEDKPGVIGAIGTEFGRRGINVSRLVLGLPEQGEKAALSAWSVDSAMPDDAVAAIRALPGVRGALRIEL